VKKGPGPRKPGKQNKKYTRWFDTGGRFGGKWYKVAKVQRQTTRLEREFENTQMGGAEHLQTQRKKNPGGKERKLKKHWEESTKFSIPGGECKKFISVGAKTMIQDFR